MLKGHSKDIYYPMISRPILNFKDFLLPSHFSLHFWCNNGLSSDGDTFFIIVCINTWWSTFFFYKLLSEWNYVVYYMIFSFSDKPSYVIWNTASITLPRFTHLLHFCRPKKLALFDKKILMDFDNLNFCGLALDLANGSFGSGTGRVFVRFGSTSG